MLRKDGVFCGPRAEDIGVRQWLNAFTSGDYVGRWLWSRDGPNDDLLGHPLAEVLQPGALGRASVYDAFAPTPPDGGELDAAAEAETCLGVGAHTHYFEPDQQEVAWLVDYLLGSRYTVTGSSRDRLGRRRGLRHESAAEARNDRHQDDARRRCRRRSTRSAASSRGADEDDRAAAQVGQASDRAEQQHDRQPDGDGDGEPLPAGPLPLRRQHQEQRRQHRRQQRAEEQDEEADERDREEQRRRRSRRGRPSSPKRARREHRSSGLPRDGAGTARRRRRC